MTDPAFQAAEPTNAKCTRCGFHGWVQIERVSEREGWKCPDCRWWYWLLPSTAQTVSQAAENARVIRTALAEASWPVYGPSLREPCYAALDRLLARCEEAEQAREEIHESYVEQLAETTEAWTKFSASEALLAEAGEALRDYWIVFGYAEWWEPEKKQKMEALFRRLNALSEARDG